VAVLQQQVHDASTGKLGNQVDHKFQEATTILNGGRRTIFGGNRVQNFEIVLEEARNERLVVSGVD
jgi:hypothetical protein